MARQFEFDATDQLCECEQKAAAVAWAVPVDHQLDRLVRLAEGAGQRTNRKELAAAIVAAVAEDPAYLGEILVRYRTMSVQDLLGPIEVGEPVYRIGRNKPGPRTRSAS